MSIRYAKAYGILAATVDVAIIRLECGADPKSVLESLVRGLERAECHADGIDPDAPIEPDGMALAKAHDELQMEKEVG